MSTILLIEDDKDQRLYLTAMLNSIGHEVVEAIDGNEGLKLFADHDIDMVITDIFMPGKEGLATIMELKQLSPDTKVIAITAYTPIYDGVLDIASELGADIVLKKPIDINDIYDALQKLLA
jgi:CheY-like chemotaxis protein